MPGMTDRDHFAVAALTGLLARGLLQSNLLAADAYKVADAMLRERGRTNHDAAPAAIVPEPEPSAARRRPAGGTGKTNHDAAPAATASVESVVPQPTTHADSDRTDKAAPRPSEGTGDTPVTEPMPKEKRAEVSDRSKPISGPDPDSRVWETPVHTPAPHATPGECSVPREGTQEPVAWAVAGDYGDYAVALFSDKASAQTEADRRAMVGLRPGYVVVPLYRSPALTDAEREAVEWASIVLAADKTYSSALRELARRLGGDR